MKNPKGPNSADSAGGMRATDNSSAADRTIVGEAGSFSLLRVFAMLVIAAIVAGAGYGIWALKNAPKGLVAYTGRVLYQGKPVVGGVMTQNLDDKFDSAGATLDEEGRFTLETNGESGANVGRHKLAVISFERGAPPRPLVPTAYTSITSTPLVVEITADPAKNHGEFSLEGTAPAPAAPAAAGSGPMPGRSPPGRTPPGESPPTDPPGVSPPSEPVKPPGA